MKEGKDVLNITINLDGIASAARNADTLDDLALEIDTVNPRKITLEQDLFTLKAAPVNDKLKGKAKEFAPQVVGIKSMQVESLSTTVKADHITINGILDIPKTGRRVVKLEECLFGSEQEARAVARILTEIELEKADKIRVEAEDAVAFIKKQLEDDRF